MELLSAAQNGDSEACEEVLKENSGLIWSVARRFFGRGVDTDDLYQLGCLGFLKAVKGYDASYGTQFSTYAVPKIAGEIRRFIRDDGSVKVSRGIKERAQNIRNARERLSHKMEREPTLSEISQETGISVEDIAVAETATSSIESLQRESGEDGLTLESMLGIDGMEDEIVERVAIYEAMNTLPERERMIIALRFFKSMTQENTARILKISQVQVSRLERSALEALRKKIK